MGNIRKNLVLLGFILFSALTIFCGCNNNVYKNLKMTLSTSATNNVVTLSENVQDNVFTVTSHVTGMPKGYNGAVVFSVPTNDAVELVQQFDVKNGSTSATFYAKEPGSVNINVVTLEGNVSSSITIKVVKQISGLSFNDSQVPIVKGVETDISKLITFNPQNTNQTDIELELIKPNENDELIKIIRNGSKITVPSDFNLTDFEIVAKSVYNERIFSRAQAKVINLVNTNDLAVTYDSGTPNDTADDKVLTTSQGEYVLELASNTDDLFEKNIYVNFANAAEAQNYDIKVVGLNDEGYLVENGIKKGVVQIDINAPTKLLTVKAIGLGTDKIILNVFRKDFPNYTEFTKQLVVAVNVTSYPTSITTTNGSSEIEELTVYANYDDDLIGAPIRFNVNNESNIMSNEKVILSLSGYEDKIELYDSWRNLLEFNTEISADRTYYIKHTLSSVPSDLKLTITSAKYNKITKTIPLRIVTQGVNLTTETGKKEDSLAIDVSLKNEKIITLGGLPNAYNYLNLTVTYDKNLLSLNQTSSRIAITPKDEIGKTTLTIEAPNGSKVRYNIDLYESLDYENTTITVAGQIIAPLELNDENVANITVKNNLTLPVKFNINNKAYDVLPDVLSYSATSSNWDVVRVASNFRLATQNVKGSAEVTIQITGYDNFGSKVRKATFKVNITVHVPLSDITVSTRETTIYYNNRINAVQKAQYGRHDIILKTQPAHASFNFDDIQWLIDYNGITYNVKQMATSEVSGNTLTYTLMPDTNVIITLVTSLDDFTKATVYCDTTINDASQKVSSVSFLVIGRIQQFFINEVGILIDATKQTDVRINVNDPIKVEQFIFDNIERKEVNRVNEYYITFDERDLGYQNGGYTTNNVKTINFDVYPANALYKDLDVFSSEPTSIYAEIDNKTGVLTVRAINRILSEYSVVTLTVWSRDSETIAGSIGNRYTEITVRILNGTRYSPFEVATTADLLKINNAMNAFYVLSDNINIGSWRPLGYVNEDTVTPFTGYISGDNKTYDAEGNILDHKQYYLSNLQITGNYSYTGLFAIIGKGAIVEDLIINGVKIENLSLQQTTNYFIGALAGFSEGTVKNVSVIQGGVDSITGATLNYNNENSQEQTDGINLEWKGLNLTNINVFVGGLIGFVNNTEVLISDEENSIISTKNENIGFLKAQNQSDIVKLGTINSALDPQILNAKASIEINVNASTPVAFVGGLVGFNNKAVITKDSVNNFNGFNDFDVVSCINAKVTTSQNENSAFGGAIGFNNGEFKNYKVKTFIPQKISQTVLEPQIINNVGGAVGYNVGAVENNTVTPIVRGKQNVGGLIGTSENTIVNFVVNENVYLNNDKQHFINGIKVNDNRTLVAYNKKVQIELITYSNLMVRKTTDEFNPNEKTFAGILKEDSLLQNIGDTIANSVATNYMTVSSTSREHMVVLQVKNFNINTKAAQRVSTVYKPNELSVNYRFNISGSTVTVDNLDMVSVEGVIKALYNSKINYVTGNKVEFLEGETVTSYKTGVSGFGNVGGLIGSYSGLYYQTIQSSSRETIENNSNIKREKIDNNLIYAVVTDTRGNGNNPLTANLKIEFVNTLEYNSVYSYHNNETIVNKWADASTITSKNYFGDVTLENTPNRNGNENVGGLIGKTNNAFLQFNSANVGVQAFNANASGIVGSSENVIQIVDSYFAGAIINLSEGDTLNTNNCGLIIGNGSLAQQTGLNYGESIFDGTKTTDYFYFAPYAITSINSTNKYFNNIVNTYALTTYNGMEVINDRNEYVISLVGNNVSNNLKYYKMLNNYSGFGDYPYVKNETKTINNVSFSLDTSKDVSYLYYGFGYSDSSTDYYRTMGFYSDDAVKASVEDYITPTCLAKLKEDTVDYAFIFKTTDSVSNVLKEVLNSYSLGIDNNSNGITDDDEVLDADSGMEVARTNLQAYNWYSYSEINNAFPVLISKNKVSGTESDYTIGLLVNFPPKSIVVSLNTNYYTIWGNIATNAYSTLYYYSLSSSNYDNLGNLNLGTGAYVANNRTYLTNRVNNEILELNTYSINDVLNYSSIPPFIGKDSFNIASSNSQILSVERANNGNMVLVAKGVGIVKLTITSSYNASLKLELTVNVINAINNLELNYYTSGNKNIVRNNSDVLVNKTTEANKQTFTLNSILGGTYNFVYDSVNANFALNDNMLSGIRYYYLNPKTLNIDGSNVNGYTVLHDRIYDADALPNITINDNTFTRGYVQAKSGTGSSYSQYYVYYIDVPTGATTNIVGLEESNTQILAVPYFVSKDDKNNDVKTPIVSTVSTIPQQNGLPNIDLGSSISYINVNGVPVAGLYTPENIDNYNEYVNNCLKLFNVKVINASYKVEKSVSAVNFFVQQTPSFYVDVLTDNKNAVLYLTYYGNNGEERSIALAKENGVERGIEKLTINGLTLRLNSIDSSSFSNASIVNKYIRYHFGLEVEDENKLNIQQVISKNFKFFIVKDNVQINFNDLGFVTNDISEVVLSITDLQVTLNPQEIVRIEVKHYPKGESSTVNGANGEQTTIGGLTEEAYDNIIPGYTGVLKINISPVFAYYDEVVLTSNMLQNSVVWFNQVLANKTLNDNGDYVYDGTYSTIAGSHDLSGRIVLSKTSFKLPNGSTEFDGNLYVKTLINSFVDESGEFVLNVQAYKNGVALQNQQIVLKVKTTPRLNLHVDGRDSAAVARGTTLSFSADHEGIEGEVDFSESYVYRINSNGLQDVVGGYGTYFNINKVDNNYVLDTSLSLDASTYICIKGTITKEINGEIYSKSDILTIKVADFTIDSISVENVIDGNFVGLFNQTYGLIVRINRYSCHDSLKANVALQVKELERKFSQVADSDGVNEHMSKSGAWYVGTEQNHGTISLGRNAANSFIFGKMSTKEFGPETTIYTIQNIRFNSGDRLVARAMYCYTNEGIKPILTTQDLSDYSSNEFTYDRYFEFGFGFYRVRSEDKPDPISTVEDFKAMEDGVDYILVNDLVLNDWEPFDAALNINSLDGNGYVITINSFKLDEKPEDNAELTDKTFGLFTQINPDTVIKNLIIEVRANERINVANESADKTSSAGDLNIDATAYRNVTFGLLAGINYGMITNVQVTYNADILKIERELAIARASMEDPKYAKFWDGDTFKIKEGVESLDETLGIKYTATVDEETGEVTYSKRGETSQRDLSIVKVNTTITTSSQTHYMGLLVGKNDVSNSTTSSSMGYITNSSVENLSINGIGYVAGFAAYNAGKISSSYFKGGNIINRAGESDSTTSATGGFVVYNTGSDASIQYSYVEGRLGDGVGYRYSALESSVTPNNADKTGLTATIKQNYSGYAYNHAKVESGKPNAGQEYRFLEDAESIGYNFNIAGLRAMNSAISATTEASAFVYENDATISNSYANILVKGSMKTSGFVFNNLENGRINSSFTLSSILVNEMAASPFTGRNSDYAYNNVTPNSISDCHYLKLGCDISDSELEQANPDTFLDEGELATAIGAGQFDEYNTFQSFAFNTDFTLNSAEEVTRSVWFIPGLGTEQIYNNNFKNNFYSLSRPQLVAANLKTTSIRVWAGSESSQENSYSYVSKVNGEDVSNPILIKSAEDFNNYLNYETVVDDRDRAFAIRFISDIAFNKTDLKANTYDMEYYGDLDGNGMNISELRLVSDTDFETDSQGKSVKYLGLFGRIITKPLDDKNSKRGVVRNLNIDVAEVRGSKVTYVGALAGEIQNANVFNINISGEEVIQGRNVVGGLAGIISGDSEIVNITSSLSAKAAYYKYPNLFKSNNSQLEDANYGKFEIYNKTEVNGTTQVKNADTISYVGGIAGIFDVDARPVNEQNKRSLFNSKARSLEVNGNVSLVGEIVGGVFGLNGATSTASDLNFIINDDSSPEFIASRVAGGIIGENRGNLERALISQQIDTQNKIDNEYKAAATTGATGYRVINTGYETLFGGNPHFIGGMVGFNNGGSISNSYSKVNVINLNSMYAGGFIGLNAGGKINLAYTTGSVSAFRSVGGFIGVQTEALVSVSEEGQKDFTKIYANEEDKTIVSSLFLDVDSGNITTENLSSENSTLSNIVSANVWREEDLYTDRSVNFSPEELKIGAFVGNIIFGTPKEGEANHAYSLGQVFQKLEANRTTNNESIYFVQPLLNRPLGTVLGLANTTLNPNYNVNKTLLMPEIGAILNDTTINNDVTSTDLTRYINGDVRRGRNGGPITNVAGSSGVTRIESSAGNGTSKTYFFSRMQNIGSARTLLEVFKTKLDKLDAGVWGDSSITNESENKNQDFGTDNDITEGIFSNWSVDYWTGVIKEDDSAATAADINTAFPYLEPKAIKSRVLVYNVSQLKQMSTYNNAEFILQNDIDLAAADELWKPVGTLANPFSGSIHSQSNPDGSFYNYKIYDSKKNQANHQTNSTDNSDYIGLIAIADDAYFHHFTLTDMLFKSNSGEQDSIYAGALFAYASSKCTVTEVAASGIKIQGKFATAGSLIGYGNGTDLNNVYVGESALNITGLSKTTEKLETDKTLYSFGGVAGMVGSEEENMVAAYAVDAYNIEVKVADSSVNANKFNEKYKRHLNIGGVFGLINPTDSVATSVAGINAKFVKIDTDLTFSGNPNNFESINIGGMAGYANDSTITTLVTNSVDEDGSMLDTYVLTNSVVQGKNSSEASKIEVDINGYAHSLNVGGVVGNIYSQVSNNYGLENVTTNASVKVTTNFSSTNSVGGVAGKVHNISVGSLNKTGGNINYTDTYGCAAYVGGLIGSLSNSIKVTNSVVKADEININVPENLYDKYINVGGAIGGADMYTNTSVISTTNPQPVAGDINKIVSAVKNINLKVNSATSYWGLLTKNVGGLIGMLNNGNVTECYANTNITNVLMASGTTRYLNNSYNFGGLVGVVDVDLNHKLNKTQGAGDKTVAYSKATIKNSYSTGYIDDINGFNGRQASGGLLVGAINYAYNNKEFLSNVKTINSAVEITNNYSIGHFSNVNTHEVETNKGGIIGAITTSTQNSTGTTVYYYNNAADSYNEYKNVTNMLIAENYYNADFVPHSNNFGSALTTEKLLFSATKFEENSYAPWNSDIWDLKANSYPLLKWIENSEEKAVEAPGADEVVPIGGISFTLTKPQTNPDKQTIGSITSAQKLKTDIVENLIGYLPVKEGKGTIELQKTGSKVKPATSYNASHDSVIFNDKKYSDSASINNKVYYFAGSGGLTTQSSFTTNANTILYGLTTNHSSGKTINNYGLITKVSAPSNSAHSGFTISNKTNGVVYNINKNAQVSLSNNGIIDSAILNLSSSLTQSSSAKVINAKISFSGDYRIVSGYVKNTVVIATNSSYMLYKMYNSDGGEVPELYVNKTTKKVFSDPALTISLKLSSLLNTSVARFDFDKTWTIINPTSETADKFNYGLPMLQLELKTNATQKRMDDNYYWSNDNVTNSEFNNYMIKYNLGNTLIINSTEELAKIATYTNYGYKMSETKRVLTVAEQSTAAETGVIYNSCAKTVNTVYNGIKLTTYEFGVVKEVNRNVLNYKGKTISLLNTNDDEDVEATLSFNNKLWTPIGYGFDNIADSDLIVSGSNGEKYLNQNLINNSNNTNLFAGKIAGNKYILSGLSAIGVNRFVGLFGSAEVDGTYSEVLPLASDILITDSTFVSTTINGGTSATGTLAGFVYANINNSDSTVNRYLTNKVGVENCVIYGRDVASGLIGKVTFKEGTNNKVIINKAYVNSDVFGNKTSGLAYVYAGGNSATTNAITATEVYYIGKLSSVTEFNGSSSSNDHALFGNYNNPSAKSDSVYTLNYYDCNAMTNSIVNNTCEQIKTDTAFRYTLLPNFDWMTTWVHKMEDNVSSYPTFTSKVEYWIDYAVKPTSINKSAKTITIKPYTIWDYEVNADGSYKLDSSGNKIIKKDENGQDKAKVKDSAAELAWVAKVLSTNERNEYNNFNGWTITINGSLNFGGPVWTPIGYIVGSDRTHAFKGTLKGAANSDIMLSNITSTAVYVYDETKPGQTKPTGVTDNGIGLVGYAENATIKDLRIGSGVIYGNENIGSFIGYAVNTILDNCKNEDDSNPDRLYVGGFINVGGMAGRFEATNAISLSNNTNRANVLFTQTKKTQTLSNAKNFGGIVGLATGNVKLENNVNNKNIIGYVNVGGIAGQIANGATVTGMDNNDSNNLALIKGNNIIGGIVGYIADENSSVSRVTNSGEVQADNYNNSVAGGIVGSTKGNIELVVNTGSVKNASYSAGIVGKIESNNVYINNVLNKLDSDHDITIPSGRGQGIVATSSSGYSAEMFGLCVSIASSTSILPLGNNINYMAYPGVFNNYYRLSATSYSYAGMDISFFDIFSQNPYWTQYPSSWNDVNIDYTASSRAEQELTNRNIQRFDLTTTIDNQAKFNYVNWLIKTNFMNGSTSKVIKPLTIAGSLNLTNDFEQLAPNSAYPLKVNVSGRDSLSTITVAGGTNGAKSILGYAYGDESKITIKNIIINNKSGNNSSYKFDYDGALLKYAHNVKIETVSSYSVSNYDSLNPTQKSEYSFNANNYFGIIASQIYNSEINRVIINKGSISAVGDYIGGIAGYINNTKIGYNGTTANKDSVNNISISSRGNSTGGIVGYATNNSKISAVNQSYIEGWKTGVGGIVGTNYSSTVYNSTNAAQVWGQGYVGGIAGHLLSSATVEGSNNNGKIAGDADARVGGIVGYSDSSTINSNNNNYFVSGYNCVGGIVGYAYSSIVSSNTSDSNSIAGTYYKQPDTGCGGIVGYSQSSSGSNNVSHGFAGYIDNSYKYSVLNFDSSSGYWSRNALYIDNGDTYGKYFNNPSDAVFKVGTVFGNYSGRSITASDVSNAISTRYVDQFTYYDGRTKDFTGSHCTVHLYTESANNNNGRGTSGGYKFSESQVYKERGKWIVWCENFDFDVYLDDGSYTLISSSKTKLPGIEGYTVTYIDGSNRETEDVIKGGVATNKQYSKEGYSFIGWCTDSALNNLYDFSQPVNSDLTLYAKWGEGKKNVVKFELQGGKYNGSGDTIIKEVKTGEKLSSSEIPSSGLSKNKTSFNGWYQYTYDEALNVYNKNGNGQSWNEFWSSCKEDFSKDIDNDVTVYAHWNHAIVTYKVEGSADNVVAVNWNSTLTKPADPVRTGYTFSRWVTKTMVNGSEVVEEFNFTTKITKDYTLYAEFEKSNITVNYYKIKDNQLNVYELDRTETKSKGDVINRPANASLDHYNFDGWYTLSYEDFQVLVATNPSLKYSSYKVTTTTITLTEDINLYPYFVPRTYTISFVDQDGTAIEGISDSIKSVQTNGTVTNPGTLTKIGHSFEGWYSIKLSDLPAGESYDDYKFLFSGNANATKIVENTTIYAYFTKNKFNVSFVDAGGVALADYPTISIEYGEKVTRPATDPVDPDGGTFRNWYNKRKNTELVGYDYDQDLFDFDTLITANTTIWAYFEPAGTEYQVNFLTQEGSFIEGFVTLNVPFKQTVKAKLDADGTELQTPVDTVDAENIFKGWYSIKLSDLPEGGNYETYKFDFDNTVIIKNINLYAYFEKPNRTIKFLDMNGEEFSTPISVVVKKGELLDSVPTAPTKEGYEFKGWYTQKYDTFINNDTGEDYDVKKVDFTTYTVTSSETEIKLYAYYVAV